jgi:hypothetical protein
VLPKRFIAGRPSMNASSFLRAIYIMALPGNAVRPYDRHPRVRHTLGNEAHGLLPTSCHRGPTVDEPIRRPDRRVQDVAAALLRMDPADRRPFIRPLIALIMRVAAEGSGPTSAPGLPANGDLHPHARTLTTAPDAAVELEPM